MHRTVQKFRGKIYLIGILLFLFVVNATAQFEEGALVKGNNDAVFLISKGKACWIPNESVFNLLGLNWNKVKKFRIKIWQKFRKDGLSLKEETNRSI